MDELKQNAIDALELLKSQYLADWEIYNASKIEEIILQIQEFD